MRAIAQPSSQNKFFCHNFWIVHFSLLLENGNYLRNWDTLYTGKVKPLEISTNQPETTLRRYQQQLDWEGHPKESVAPLHGYHVLNHVLCIIYPTHPDSSTCNESKTLQSQSTNHESGRVESGWVELGHWECTNIRALRHSLFVHFVPVAAPSTESGPFGDI